MLLVWPLVMAFLFKRMPVDRALVWSILGGYLFLPPSIAINLPVVPDLNKNSIPALMAAALVVFARKERFSILPDGWLARALILLFVLSPFATVLTNREALPKGPTIVQGMAIYDSVAAIANQAIELLPFFLARRYLATPGAMRNLLAVMMAGGLIYTLPMLVEIRMSPQMNVWIYGFFQHDFFQTIRFGGYRPVVFLPHGLWVAMFAVMAATAGLVLARHAPKPDRSRLIFATLWLFVVLILTKSTGALVYGAALILLVLFASRRVQIVVAAALAGIVLLYPLLRGAQLVPLEQIVDLASRVSLDRAQSFQFRVDNEEALLARANLKPLFGWGGYGRNMLFDPVTGRDLSIADGAWIIRMGMYGWLGYIALFGLLTLPVLKLGREALRRSGDGISPWAAGLALILAVNLLDLLPNATLVPLTWLLAGAVLGQAEALARGKPGDAPDLPPNEAQPRRPKTVL